MRLALFLLAVMLGGCAPGPSMSYRDTSVPIGVSTRFDAARFAGNWAVRARFSDEEVSGPQVWSVRVTGTDTISVTDAAQGPNDVRRYTIRDGARFVPIQQGPQLWVLWVDDGYRTAAIGNADGTIGLILDRNTIGGTDRVAAASDILEWRGYDMSKLKQVKE